MDDLQIFSDGSGIDGKIGAAATIFNLPNKPMLHYHLGSDKEHTVFEGETVGVLLSVRLVRLHIRTLKHRIRSVLIALDNQPAISALEKNRRQPAQYLLDAVHHEIERLRHEQYGIHIHIAWTPGHHDVPGNEYVDTEAKKAANGLSSRRKDIPNLLHSPLPKSVAAMRAARQKHNNDEWIEQWKQSPRYEKFNKIDPDLPNRRTFKTLASLSRQGASLLVQLRTGAVALNCFLKKIKQHHSVLCETCRTPETVNHYLLLCRRFREQRRALRIAVGRRANSIKAVLGNPKHFRAIANYVQATGRFVHYNTKSR